MVTTATAARAEGRNRAVVILDDGVEVFDIDSQQQLNRFSIEEPQASWNRMVSRGGYLLVEYDYYRAPDRTLFRKLQLFDGDGKLLWRREVPQATNGSNNIFVSEDGFATFETPEGGVVVDRDGTELWRGPGSPVGPVIEGSVPLRRPSEESIGWLNVADKTYSQVAPKLKHSERGAFVEGRELVFADGVWLRPDVEEPGVEESVVLAAHVVKRVRLPSGCQEPFLDDTRSSRYWRLKCTFERSRFFQDIAYRVDLRKMTLSALKRMPPGWKSEEEVVCPLHQKDDPNRDVLADLGPDGFWYSSTHDRKSDDYVWQSSNGSDWRRAGEMFSVCRAPDLQKLCGRVIARPVNHAHNCGSSGVPEEPLWAQKGRSWQSMTYVPGVVNDDWCSEDGLRFLEYNHDQQEGRLTVTALATGERKLIRTFARNGPQPRKVLWLTPPEMSK